MKFGKKLVRLQHPQWASHYVNYKALKKTFKSAEGVVSSTRHSQCKFSIYNELRKANAFWKGAVADLEARISNTEGGSLEAVVRLCEEMAVLSDFGILNYLALLKILKKHDKLFPDTKLTPAVVPLVLASEFLQQEPLYRLAEKIQDLQQADAADVGELMGVLSKPLAQRVTSILDSADEGEDETVPSKYNPEFVESQQSSLAMKVAAMRAAHEAKQLQDSVSTRSRAPQDVDAVMSQLGVPCSAEPEGFSMSSTLVGQGSFGRVFLCTGPDGEQCAAKVIPMRAEHMNKVVGEVSALLRCQGSPYVLDLMHACYTAQPSVTLVSSLCDCELYEVVISQAPLPMDRARRLFVQLCQGLQHVHNSGFCHRDIKLENLLLVNDTLKIADFGFATAWCDEDGMVTPHNRKCGSIAYVAPEAYLGQDYDGRMLDVWSAGVILFVLVCAAFPFEAPDATKCPYFKSHAGGKLHFPEPNLEPALIELIKLCLDLNPVDRPSCQELQAHQWCAEPEPPAQPVDPSPEYQEQPQAPQPPLETFSKTECVSSPGDASTTEAASTGEGRVLEAHSGGKGCVCPRCFKELEEGHECAVTCSIL